MQYRSEFTMNSRRNLRINTSRRLRRHVKINSTSNTSHSHPILSASSAYFEISSSSLSHSKLHLNKHVLLIVEDTPTLIDELMLSSATIISFNLSHRLSTTLLSFFRFHCNAFSQLHVVCRVSAMGEMGQPGFGPLVSAGGSVGSWWCCRRRYCGYCEGS
ncbi:Intracellular heme transport protein HutX [Dirofilaria immitis]